VRILILNNTRPTADNPKSGSYVATIGNAIKAAGFDVDYLLPKRVGQSASAKVLSYLSHYLQIVRFPFQRYDLLYVNHYTYLGWPLLVRFPWLPAMVIHWHGDDLLPPSKAKELLFAPLLRAVPRRVHHIVPSQYFCNVLRSRLGAVDVTVSPSGGVNLSQFVATNGARKDILRIGYASGLDDGKGLEELIHLCDSLDRISAATGHTVEVHYIDYGPKKGALQSRESELNGRLIRWSTLPHGEMPRFYNSVDVVVFPTRRKAESLGLIPLEAMACGVPVVATNMFACPEYVVPGVSGELFAPGEPGDFLEKLLLYASRREQYRPRGVVEDRYSFERVVEQYKKILPIIAGK